MVLSEKYRWLTWAACMKTQEIKNTGISVGLCIDEIRLFCEYIEHLVSGFFLRQYLCFPSSSVYVTAFILNPAPAAPGGPGALSLPVQLGSGFSFQRIVL